MVSITSEAQIERWRFLKDQQDADTAWVEYQRQRDAKRLLTQRKMLGLLDRFLRGEAGIEEIRAAFQKGAATNPSVFGLDGMAGGMFINMLVKHFPERDALVGQLKIALCVPNSEAEGRQRMTAFLAFLENAIRAGKVARRSIQPARTPFFLSVWWHLQDTEQWPIYYDSGRNALALENSYSPSNDLVDDYFKFRQCFISLAAALNLKAWEFEHVLSWRMNQNTNKVPPVTDTAGSSTKPTDNSSASEEEEEGQPVSNHAQVQLILAEIGQKLGCRIWIASNDHGKTWNGKRLGDLSIKSLPSLGMDNESQRIISLIDVLWLKSSNQVVAAFEVEHTTSIYSGLLRLSDLVALSPNINFPLYIVTPKTRLDQVRRELSRPTFQTLELHRRCGFFSNEVLISESNGILRWADNPSAIDKLAVRVGDVSNE